MQETFEEALWPRHLEYRNSVIAESGSVGNLHVLDAEQPPAKIVTDALPIVDDWAARVVAEGRHGTSAEKTSKIALELRALEAASTAAEKARARTSASRPAL